MAKKLNGALLKNFWIILCIVAMLGGVIWALATQSGDLEDAVEDIAEQKKEYNKVELRVDTVEKAVIKIETTMGHFKEGQDDMMTMQKEILDELRK